jgi:Zn-dependent protease with chaperone function
MRVAALLIVLANLACASVAAQAASATPAAAADTATATGSNAGSAPARDYVAEVRANFTPENRAYSRSRWAYAFIDPLYGVAVCLFVLTTGASARIRDLAHRLSARRYVRALVYVALYSLLAFVLSFPLAYAEDFALEHRYQLSNQSFGGWLGDQAKALMIQVIFLGVIPIAMLAYRRIGSSPRRWWLWFSCLSLPFITAMILIQPLVIEPAFNKFTPLKDQHLRASILAEAARAGIPARRVDQVDKSAQTNTYNAYVSGFGPSQHVVLWDTTLKGMDEREILFVTGHEIGHYVLHHIWKGIAFISLLSFLFFWLTWRVAAPLARRYGPRWGFTELHDLASMPMLIGVLTVVLFVLAPVFNWYSREAEHQADVFALEITRDNDAGARAFIKLGSQNRSNPEPPGWATWALYDHPPLIERVQFAIGYRPWEHGQPDRFFHERGAK